MLLGGWLAITIVFHDCVQWTTFTNEPNVALSGVVIERRRRSCNQGGCLLDVVIRPLDSQIKSDIGQIVLRQNLSCLAPNSCSIAFLHTEDDWETAWLLPRMFRSACSWNWRQQT